MKVQRKAQCPPNESTRQRAFLTRSFATHLPHVNSKCRHVQSRALSSGRSRYSRESSVGNTNQASVAMMSLTWPGVHIHQVQNVRCRQVLPALSMFHVCHAETGTVHRCTWLIPAFRTPPRCPPSSSLAMPVVQITSKPVAREQCEAKSRDKKEQTGAIKSHMHYPYHTTPQRNTPSTARCQPHPLSLPVRRINSLCLFPTLPAPKRERCTRRSRKTLGIEKHASKWSINHALTSMCMAQNNSGLGGAMGFELLRSELNGMGSRNSVVSSSNDAWPPRTVDCVIFRFVVKLRVTTAAYSQLGHSSYGRGAFCRAFAQGSLLHGNRLLRLLLRYDFASVELDEHGPVGFNLLDGHRKSEVVEQQKLQLEMVEFGQW